MHLCSLRRVVTSAAQISITEIRDLFDLFGAGQHRLHAVAHLQLLENGLEVRLDGVLGNFHRLGNFFVAFASAHMPQHLLFAVGQVGRDGEFAVTFAHDGATTVAGAKAFVITGIREFSKR